MTFTYPQNDLDQPQRLLSMLGSFWSGLYQGNDLIETIVAARAKLEQQTQRDLMELLASVSRFSVPIFHREHWTFLSFLESDVNQSEALILPYLNEATEVYSSTTTHAYGVVQAQTTFSVETPANLVDVRLALNRMTDPSKTWVHGVDFWLSDGLITFRQNPFDDEFVARQEIWENGEIVDRMAGLWLYHGQWEWHTTYEQFGYALKLQMQSSEGYRTLVNALLDALAEGTKIRDVQQAWSAITGVPLTKEDGEVVESIRNDSRHLVIVTDRHAYTFTLGSTPLVAVGQVLKAGEPLTATLQFYELQQGDAPSDLTSLTLGSGFLASGYYSTVTFDNVEKPLVVETDSEGYTKVSWELGGFPGDLEKFWDDVHQQGKLKGKTLAHFLDTRANPQGEPTAAMLPATINPLQFLCSNFLWANCFLVRIQSRYLHPTRRLGLYAAEFLRKIIPPHTAMLVIVELEVFDSPVIMDGPGDETRPGYSEQAYLSPVMPVSETLNGTSMVQERVILKQLAGRCE